MLIELNKSILLLTVVLFWALRFLPTSTPARQKYIHAERFKSKWQYHTKLTEMDNKLLILVSFYLPNNCASVLAHALAGTGLVLRLDFLQMESHFSLPLFHLRVNVFGAKYTLSLLFLRCTIWDTTIYVTESSCGQDH